MNRNSGKIAVILLNLGAPESLDDIKPFLSNLFNDPDIIDLPMGKILRPILAWNITRKRLPESMQIYENIGGGSPLRRLSQKQAEALESKLSENGDFKVYIAMRYWHPFTEIAVEELSNSGALVRVGTRVPLVCSVVFGKDEAYGAQSTDPEMAGLPHTDHRAPLRGLEAGCLLTASNSAGEHQRLPDDELLPAIDRMIEVALEAAVALSTEEGSSPG